MTPTSPQDKGRPSAKLEVVRQYRGGVLHRELLLGHSQGARTASVSGNGNQQQWPSGLDLAGALLAPFLPKGFPDSVTSDYAPFQLWDTSQGLCSYVRGMLCQKAIMVGIGVGQEAATPIGALFHFFMRDFIGMLGGIAFAYCQGGGLDSHAKQWRLFADCINNVGLALELASPLLPGHFLLLACLGSVARSLCGVAAGATRAAMTQHFALARNAADISAKEGSQETATTLIGMLIGMLVTHFVSDIPAYAWATFVVLTILHVYFNIRAVRCLCLRSLNPPRLDALVAWSISNRGDVLTPEALAAMESLLAPPVQKIFRLLKGCPVIGIELGTPVENLIREHGAVVLRAKADLHALHVTRRKINVVLHRRVEAKDVVSAYVHASAVMHLANSNKGVKERTMAAMLQESDKWLGANMDNFFKGLVSSGWDTSRMSIAAGEWRAEWPAAYAVDMKHMQ